MFQSQNLTITYGPTTAVDEVSLTVTEGELLTLVGPSGSGKTTLIRAIAGLESINDGRIWLSGDCVSSVSTEVPPQHRDVGMVFQGFALWPHKTVAENVRFPLEQTDQSPAEIRDRTEEVLSLVELTEFADRSPGTLSGGQQQRVALARALAPDPSILLLDECFSSLDESLKSRMLEEVRQLQEELGITTIYVTHNQRDGLQVADRVAVLRGGRLQQVGTPTAVYSEPANRFVAEFIGEITILDVAELERAIDGQIQCSTDRVGVRPEDVRLTQPARADGSAQLDPVLGRSSVTVDGQVSSRQFSGDRLQYRISVPNAEAVELDAVTHPRTEFAVGNTVAVTIDPEALVPIEE